MIFQQLRIGDYFRIPGISFACVYRKASSSSCTLDMLLRPIRRSAIVVPLNRVELSRYIQQRQEFLTDLDD
ncbi:MULTISPECIES: hypothetical protein [unclassified Tolypothrix]|uniref:hypothetical protein n=1 Tax=unclassified Tolypothrix TaxID=2649714 RepID=UPI0005EAB02F|nr:MULTISPECIES: hypothetical protein [unclassified Tolypothrix]EKE97398.1 hypothetical protein FDUTEX481_05106 [Tolypothrix sp. PCC 7601]MBE9087194.1 hypothetical protein [Tolypothrix sp. LEGE 11397]UYD33443.1 hypothetical protein HG267_31700 [Tolypothrix sp. PCC 7601]